MENDIAAPPKRKRTGRKRTDIEVLHRREVVRVVLVEERWTPKVRAHLCEQFDVSDRQLRQDRERIQAEMLAEFDEDVRLHRMRLSNRMRHLYTQSLAAKEHGHAILATKEEGKMLGAYAPRQDTLMVSGGVELTVTGAQAVAGDPIAHARQILDPTMQAWARAVLATAGEAIPGVLEAPPLLESTADTDTDSD